MWITILVVALLGALIVAAIIGITRLPPTRPRGTGLGGYFQAPLMNTPLDDVRWWKRHRRYLRKPGTSKSEPTAAPAAHDDVEPHGRPRDDA